MNYLMLQLETLLFSTKRKFSTILHEKKKFFRFQNYYTDLQSKNSESPRRKRTISHQSFSQLFASILAFFFFFLRLSFSIKRFFKQSREENMTEEILLFKENEKLHNFEFLKKTLDINIRRLSFGEGLS
jgi:hypothetical protein